MILKFTCSTKTEYTKTENTFTAVLTNNHRKKHTLNVMSRTYLQDKLKSNNAACIYFDTLQELKENMEYYYNLCKNNIFTTKIEIIWENDV